jgi:hypothetical protein
MYKQIFRFISILFLSCSAHVVYAQATFQSDKELKKIGDNLFNEGNYLDGYTQYSQLVMRNPRNPEYNYAFGVCAIYAAPDKEQAIPFLELAATSSEVSRDVLFYLGKAYMLTYRFEDAIAKFEEFKQVTSPKNLQKFEVETHIKMCNNGSHLVRNISDWVVVDKKELNKKDFFLAYEVPTQEGKFLIKPNDETFKTPIDLKNKEESVIFLSKANEQIYFSSYGNDGTHGKDIYKIVKLPNGEWSKPQALPVSINTDNDEDFPFLHPDGKTLFFCSKGHKSMGGYDIFKSIFNEEEGRWSEPQNMGFPINSPDDDILYVVDKSEKFAFFSSSRSSSYGKYSVYKIDIEKKPADWALVKGKVVKNRNEQELSTRITVKDMQDNSLIGIYNSNDKNGKYFLALPNGSSCMFTVENTDFKTQSQVINIPLRYELNPMKQELSYELNSGKLIIKTIADASGIEDDAEDLPSIVKDKSQLNITPANPLKTKATEIPTEEVETMDEDNTLADTRLNNDDIIRMAYEDAKELDNDALELKEQARVTMTVANKRNEIALNKLKEAQQLLDDVTRFAGDGSQKQILQDKANAAKTEADLLKQDAMAAYSLAQKLENAANKKRKEADLALEYAKALEAASKSKNSPELAVKLAEIEKQLEQLNQSKTDTVSVFDSYKLALDNKQKDLDKAKNTKETIINEIKENEVLIAKSQLEADNTRNKSLKEGLLNEIEGLKQDNIDKESEIKKYDAKVKRLQDEYNLLSKEAAMAGDIASKPVDVAVAKPTPPAPLSKPSVAVTPPPSKPMPVKPVVLPPPTATVAIVSKPTIPKSTSVTATLSSVPPPEEISYDEILQKINSFNGEELGAVEKVANELERETKKLKILTSWSKDLDAFVKEQKDYLVQETNINKKENTTKLIGKASATSSEKKILAAQVKAKLDSLKQPPSAGIVAKAPESVPSLTTTSVSTIKPITPVVTNSVIASLKPVPPAVTNSTVAVATKTLTPVKTNSIVAVKEIAAVITNSVASVKPIEPDKSVTDPQQIFTGINKDNEENYASTKQIEEELERENAKANILNLWADELERFIKDQKQSLAIASDEVQKKQITDMIKKAGTLSREKRLMAQDALSKIEVLNEAVTANTSTITVVNEKKSDKDIYMVFLAINKRNNVQLDSILKNTKDIDREMAQSGVYEKWAEELSEFIDDQRLSINEEKNFNQKTYKEKTINEAIALMNQKKSLATKATLKAALIRPFTETATEIIKPEVEATPSVTPVPVKVVTQSVTPLPAKSKSKTLEEELAESEKIKDTYDREKTKEDIYKRMAKRADGEVVKFKQLTAKEIDVNKKAGLAKEISKQEGLAKEYRELAKRSLIAAEYYLQNKNKPYEGLKEADLIPSPKIPAIAASSKPIVKSAPIAESKPVRPVPPSVVVKPKEEITPSLSNEDELYEIYNRYTRVKEEISLAKNEKFDVKPKSVYTPENPIPVGNIPANGLVYMVQVGSFKNSIPSATFGGIKPITSEKTDMGYIRYLAGEFTKFNSANLVKGQIRNIGFNDAFVVAFYNGERIPLNEAFTIEGISGQSVSSSVAVSSSAFPNKKDNLKNNENSPKSTTIISANTTSAQAESNIAASPQNKSETEKISVPSIPVEKVSENNSPIIKSLTSSPDQVKISSTVENIATVGGLFYTVQVGVFSQAMSSETFNNAKPLFSENIEGGKVRYNVGIYDNLLRASEAKAILVEAGLTNAFVTAFFNDKRIPVSEAKRYEANGTAKFPVSPVLNVLPVLGTELQVKESKQPVNTLEKTTAPELKTNKSFDSPIKLSKPNTPIANPKPILSITYAAVGSSSEKNRKQMLDNVAFKVQIGAYREQVPVEQANLFFKLSDKDFNYYKDANGVTIYTAGNFKTYEEAVKLKADLLQNYGISGAFIVAYKDGKKAPLSEIK